MARVLIAWELGEAFGHLARCLRLAHGLVARGHGVTLALKDVRLPAGQTTAAGITVRPAPLTPPAGTGGSPLGNYADVLRVSGFADAREVTARLTAWQGLFSLGGPDVLVADPLLSGWINPDCVATSLREVLDNPTYRPAARALRSRHADSSPS